MNDREHRGLSPLKSSMQSSRKNSAEAVGDRTSFSNTDEQFGSEHDMSDQLGSISERMKKEMEKPEIV